MPCGRYRSLALLQTQTDPSLKRPNRTSSKNKKRLKKSGIRASKPNCSLHHLSLAKRVVGESKSFLAAEQPKLICTQSSSYGFGTHWRGYNGVNL